MKKLICVILISLLMGFSSSEKIALQIEIPENYTGWCYIIPTSNNTDIQIKNGKYLVNGFGIGYVDTVVFNNSEKLKVYKNGREITDIGTKFLSMSQIIPSGVSYNEAIKNKSTVPVCWFYVLNNEELKKEKSYWENSDNRMPFIRQPLIKLDSLEKLGILKLK